MNQNIYVLHDLVAKTYTQPFFLHNDNEAKRLFLQWVKNPELPISAHPDDYSLYHIGFYDTDAGEIEGISIPNLIMKGSSINRNEQVETDEPFLTAVESMKKAIGDNDNV